MNNGLVFSRIRCHLIDWNYYPTIHAHNLQFSFYYLQFFSFSLIFLHREKNNSVVNFSNVWITTENFEKKITRNINSFYANYYATSKIQLMILLYNLYCWIYRKGLNPLFQQKIFVHTQASKISNFCISITTAVYCGYKELSVVLLSSIS